MLPKFRAWHKEYQIMAPMLRWDSVCNLVWVSIDQCYDDRDEEIPHKWSFKDIELMQWTGFKDKTAKDIFEGDIVVHYAAWGTDAFAMERVASTNQLMARQLYFDADLENLDKYDWNCFIVEGNIYQHPELLEAQE